MSPSTWLRNFRVSGWLAAFALVLFGTSRAWAIDVYPWTGFVDRAPISGSNRHQDPGIGVGLMTRVTTLGKLGNVEIAGFSDFKWSEMSIAKYFYIYGNPPQTDPQSTKEMTITRYSDLTVTGSYGVGFFSHNTRTQTYDLPTLVTGAEGVLRVMGDYMIDDRWSVFGLLSGALAISPVDMNFNMGVGVGFGYRF